MPTLPITRLTQSEYFRFYLLLFCHCSTSSGRLVCSFSPCSLCSMSLSSSPWSFWPRHYPIHFTSSLFLSLVLLFNLCAVYLFKSSLLGSTLLSGCLSLHRPALRPGSTGQLLSRVVSSRQALPHVYNSFYVYDPLAGTQTPEEAIRLLNGVDLRKWRSSSTTVMDAIPEELHELSLTKILNQDSTTSHPNAPGIFWAG